MGKDDLLKTVDNGDNITNNQVRASFAICLSLAPAQEQQEQNCECVECRAGCALECD